MTLIERANTIDVKKECFKCGGKKIKELDWQTPPYDWQCESCKTYQLDYLKSKGFRYYAFLLSGSWTSKYFIARSLKEAHKRAVEMYRGKHEVVGSYLRGGLDRFSLDGWFSI